jgi:hypothetical protein
LEVESRGSTDQLRRWKRAQLNVAEKWLGVLARLAIENSAAAHQ